MRIGKSYCINEYVAVMFPLVQWNDDLGNLHYDSCNNQTGSNMGKIAASPFYYELWFIASISLHWLNWA